MKQIRTILIRNFISPIALAIYGLALGLLYVGELRDAWFISFVIVVNSIIASVQEVRAYLTLKKIELMSQPRAKVWKDGEFVEVIFTELAVGDKIFLKSGDEIPADARILTANSFEVNESMLTGESVPIVKNPQDLVLSSAIVVAGEAEAEVLAVGDNTKAGQMAKKLKAYKPKLTPIQRKISFLISRMSFFALFLAVLIWADYAFLGHDPTTILRAITSAAVVVVPEGLLLASSLFFAYGSLKLLQANVLPQKISAIEDMALLEVLCTDKTGTLTSPDITFENLDCLRGEATEIGRILIEANSQTKDLNATARAILGGLKAQKLTEKGDFKVLNSMAFSSSRKLSGLTFEFKKQKRTIVFGAPEFILRNFDEDFDSGLSKDALAKKIDDLASQGMRVLLLAEFAETAKNIESNLEKAKLRPLAVLTLRNNLRPNVQETVEFLQNRGVNLRVISGDNPRTVSYIAGVAGVKDADKFTTGAHLAELSAKEFEKAVLENTIFARVLPEQKERIIGVFQKHKFYTGMIGDGVNDALAIKKADLGIAMFDSAPATRRVADLVLMDNSFTSLPSGVKIGNRIMLSIEMIAILFFHKIILGVTILFATMLAGIPYPFLPRHITYMNFILVTLPTVLTTLFPPIPRQKINPKNFWRDTLLAIAPIAFLSGITVTAIYLTLKATAAAGDLAAMRGVLATVVISAAFFGVFATILSEVALGSKPSKNNIIRRILYITIALIFTFTIFGSRILRDFFEFNVPSVKKIGFVLGVVAFTAIVQLMISRSHFNLKIFKKRQK